MGKTIIKILMKINMVALGLNVFLNLLLVPFWGYPAAAVATLMSMFFSYVAVWLFLTRQLKEMVIIKTFIKPVLACLVMTIVLLQFGQLHLFLKIGVGIGVYGLASLLLSVFSRDGMALLSGAFVGVIRNMARPI